MYCSFSATLSMEKRWRAASRPQGHTTHLPLLWLWRGVLAHFHTASILASLTASLRGSSFLSHCCCSQKAKKKSLEEEQLEQRRARLSLFRNVPRERSGVSIIKWLSPTLKKSCRIMLLSILPAPLRLNGLVTAQKLATQPQEHNGLDDQRLPRFALGGEAYSIYQSSEHWLSQRHIVV